MSHLNTPMKMPPDYSAFQIYLFTSALLVLITSTEYGLEKAFQLLTAYTVAWITLASVFYQAYDWASSPIEDWDTRAQSISKEATKEKPRSEDWEEVVDGIRIASDAIKSQATTIKDIKSIADQTFK